MNTQHRENDIVGYVNGKAIVKDDSGRWFFLEIPEEFVSPGEQIFEDDLTPLTILDKEEQNMIAKELAC